MRRAWVALAIISALCWCHGQGIGVLAGKRVAFLGDSITQGGGYVSLIAYFLDRSHPEQTFDLYGLGLSSETLSGLSEAGHAGGKFPRPCLFERLPRLLERVKPEVVFACYGMNDGIYLPLDEQRFEAFKCGVARLIDSCQAAGVAQIFLITPPLYDFPPGEGGFNYDTVLAAYAAWEQTVTRPGVRVIDLHTPMARARASRSEAFSKDRIHPGEEGHLLMARTILAGAGIEVPAQELAAIKADPLYALVAQRRAFRSGKWMAHIGYTREKTVEPQPLGDAEDEAARMQVRIDALRRR